MINTIKGRVVYMNPDTVSTKNGDTNVLHINVRTTKPSYKKEGGAVIAQVNLTVWDSDLIEILQGEMALNDFVEVMMGDAIVNGNYVNGTAYDVAYIDHEEYLAPVYYRDVSNAPSGKVEREDNADAVED